MARTSSRTIARWSPAPPQRAARDQERRRNPPPKQGPHPAPKPARSPTILLVPSPEERLDESVPAVHFAASSDHPLDGRRAAGWLRSLPPASCVSAPPGRLSDHSDPDLLSRCQPRRHGFFCHRSARAPVWPNTPPQPDDLFELLWQLHHHAA